MANSVPQGKRRLCPVCKQHEIKSTAGKQCSKCRYTPGWHTGTYQPYGLRRKEKDQPTDSTTVTGDSAELTKATPERVRTLADLIRVCEIDTSEWEVERWVCNKWESAAKVDESITVTPLFQVKAWLKRKTAILDARAELAAMKEDAKRAAKPYPAHPRIAKRTGNLLELCLPELHMGKLAWGKETGYEDYDVRIAEKLSRAASRQPPSV